MYTIYVYFAEDSNPLIYQGNFIIEGGFVRINYDHDENKKTPQRTIVYPMTKIDHIDCAVIQNGVGR